MGQSFWGPDAVSSMVAFCPALRDLTLDVHALAVAALSGLTALEHLNLWVDSTAVNVGGSIDSIAVCTSLRQLSLALWCEAPPQYLPTSQGALLPLTALRALTSCSIRSAPEFCCKTVSFYGRLTVIQHNQQMNMRALLVSITIARLQELSC